MAANNLKTATIANAATKSDAVDMQGTRLCGVSFPAAFTGASVSFEVSVTGTTFVPLYDSFGNLITVTKPAVLPARCVVSPPDFYGVQHLKVVSASAEAAERAVSLISEGY